MVADRRMAFSNGLKLSVSAGLRLAVSSGLYQNPALQDSHRVFNLDCELVSQLPIEIIYWYLNKYGKTE